MSGTGVAVFRNFGIPCLDIFLSRLAIDFWNREYILMTGGSRDFLKVFV